MWAVSVGHGASRESRPVVAKPPPISESGSSSGWIGVGMQRLEEERAAEARIEARIRAHRRTRVGGSAERPLLDLAPSVLASMGVVGSSAALTAAVADRAVAYANGSIAASARAGASSPAGPVGRGAGSVGSAGELSRGDGSSNRRGSKASMRKAAAAYGAPVVGRKSRRSKSKGRARPAQHASIALL